MKKRLALVAFLLFCIFGLSHSQPAFAAAEPVVTDPTTNKDEIYDRYKDNSFELMTKDYDEGFFGNKIKEAFVNLSGTLKNLTWGGVKGLGQFNTEMVKFLFSMDVITPIRGPMQKLTSSIATNMTSIAGTIGITVVVLVIGFRFFAEQNFKRVFQILLTTIVIFTGLAVCRDADSNDSLFAQLFNIDRAIETEFVKVNPVFGDENSMAASHTIRDENGREVEVDYDVNERMKNAGDLIASQIFYTNVFEPYLLMNYGTTNVETIRKKDIELDGASYDRIQVLLDNDVDTNENEKLHEEAMKYEADELSNKAIQYFTNLQNCFYGIFYIVVNLIQTLVYFVLAFLRLVIAVMQLFLMPLLPIMLFAGLFLIENNLAVNYFKGFGMTMLLKAMTGFLVIFFATFLSLGFSLSNAVDNPWQKILTILIYLLTPLGIWTFRKFLGGMLLGKVKLSDMASFSVNPVGTERRLRNAYQEQAKTARQSRKNTAERKKAEMERKKKEAEKSGRTTVDFREKPGSKEQYKKSAKRQSQSTQDQTGNKNQGRNAGKQEKNRIRSGANTATSGQNKNQNHAEQSTVTGMERTPNGGSTKSKRSTKRGQPSVKKDQVSNAKSPESNEAVVSSSTTTEAKERQQKANSVRSSKRGESVKEASNGKKSDTTAKQSAGQSDETNRTERRNERRGQLPRSDKRSTPARASSPSGDRSQKAEQRNVSARPARQSTVRKGTVRVPESMKPQASGTSIQPAINRQGGNPQVAERLRNTQKNGRTVSVKRASKENQRPTEPSPARRSSAVFRPEAVRNQTEKQSNLTDKSKK
ncbi:hypothetical protein [Candidatus Enterococcus leclercqii]|uniref:hypothetical protein n=1 Tax=Candidatus Enterococcus leclercqii TaxID=1857218 RepID=UPI00137A9908|nr:hypothetical protein [Enterococcus sp. CU9D]KAF1294145.1 hypothetical protein BAU14_07080 [Enterococcus sp. CU9D]